MTSDDVWPNAPLALVVVEARFPAAGSGRLGPPVHRAIRDVVGNDWVLEIAKQHLTELSMVNGALTAPNATIENITRITTRDRTQAVTVRADSLTIEVTRYDGYQKFRSLLESALKAVEAVLGPDGVTRLGMRYIDEIRVPQLVGEDPWAEWLDDDLQVPRIEGLTTKSWTSAVQYDTGTDRGLVLRYGPVEASSVSPDGPLKRPRPVPAGPAFVLDFDSSWAPSDIPAFSAPDLLSACDNLRGPVRRLFHHLISPRLIDEVFKREGAS